MSMIQHLLCDGNSTRCHECTQIKNGDPTARAREWNRNEFYFSGTAIVNMSIYVQSRL